MVGKRTGPLFLVFFQQVLIAIGKPLLRLLLIIGYTLVITIAALLRSIIYIIKLFNNLTTKVRKATSQQLLTIYHSSRLCAQKYSVRLQTPIKHFIKIPKTRIKLPTRQIKISRIKIALTSIIIILVGISAIIVSETIKELPNPDSLRTRNQIVSTKIYDRNGVLLYKIFNNENRTLINLDDVPQHLINATIAIEDKDFFTHAGYSYTGILRAIRQIVISGNVQGGSTITQQLVKNTLLTKEQTLERKVKEIILAILVETKFTKNEILTMYFNEVGYGGAAYGVEEASLMYFGKSAKNLSLAESALLAGLPAAPTYHSPFGTHPERAKFRQHEVLRRMKEESYITQQQFDDAKENNLKFSYGKTDIKSPHFVMYVKEKLVEEFGEQMVEQGGLEVITTLDIGIQNLAQQAVTNEVNSLSKLKVSNGASLVTKPNTGEILAMVGSKNFFNAEEDGQVNVTLRPRQPGSAIKPINYAVALENGFTAATIIPDTPITYEVSGQPPYSPKNYDNTFHGNITLRQALASSYNVPAVKTLSIVGVENMIEKGKRMGITTWEDETRFGLSLTLGGGEVMMTDISEVYGTLANGGKHINLNPIIEVRDYHGDVLYQNNCVEQIDKSHFNTGKVCDSQQVIKPEVAYILTSILSDNDARSQAFGRHSVLNIPSQQIAVKTGTTQNLRDNWTIGYTQDYLVATWVGNNDNSPMSYVASGITGASPIWNKIITEVIKPHPESEFHPPDSLVQVDICPFTGTLPCEGCPGKKEYFIRGTEPTKTCIPIATSEEETETESEQNKETALRRYDWTIFE